MLTFSYTGKTATDWWNHSTKSFLTLLPKAKAAKTNKFFFSNRNVLAQNKAHTRNQGDNRILYEGGRAAGYFGTDGVYYGGRNCK